MSPKSHERRLSGRTLAVLAGTVAVIAGGAIGIRQGEQDEALPPERTENCFPQPGACGFPDPDYDNVGVPVGTSLTPSGAITVSTPGTIIDGLDITTSTSPAINVTADNVTIQNTRITGNATGGPNNRLITTCSNCDTLIKDVEMTTGPSGFYEFAVHGCGGCGSNHSNDILQRVYQHGNIDMLLWCEGVCSVSDSYSHLGKPDGTGGWEPAWSLGPGLDDHLENLYCNDCTFTADHNTLFLPVPQTATFFGQANNGTDVTNCANNISVTDSLLAGGGRIFEPCAHTSAPGSSVITFTGNRIARCADGDEETIEGGLWICPGLEISHNDGEGYYPNGGSFSLTGSYHSSGSTWSGNVWDKDSTTIPEPQMATYTDDFNRANETPLSSGTWGLSGTGAWNLASNQASHATDATDSETYYVSASALGDSFSQAKMTGLGGASGDLGPGLVCRHIGTSTRTCIRAIVNANGDVYVHSFTGGSSTNYGSRTSTGFVANDILRMEVSGTSPNIVVKVFRNGVQIGASYTGVSGPNTGKPGIAYSSTTNTTCTLDDWSGGDTTTPTTVTVEALLTARPG